MTYLEFRKALISFKIFSIRDIEKLFPDFDDRRLFEWQQKGYLRKLVNRWYLFTEISLDEEMLYRISNCLYRPSYISLESALSYYDLIPEAVYTQQAVTTRKTISYTTPAGTFNYRTIKEAFFFGYRIIHKDQLPVLMAEIEKALLDYLYFNASLTTARDIEALRFNYAALENSVDWNKLEKYAVVFESKILNKRVKNLKKLLPHVSPV